MEHIGLSIRRTVTLCMTVALSGIVEGQTRSVQGTIRDKDSLTAISGATVLIRDETQNVVIDTTVSDGSGHYVSLFGLTGVLGPTRVPPAFKVYPNYPNPFNPSTIIRVDLPGRGGLRLEITNIIGQRIAGYAADLPAGSYEFSISGLGAAGAYFYRISNGDRAKTGKMLLLDGGAPDPRILMRHGGSLSGTAKRQTDQYSVTVRKVHFVESSQPVPDQPNSTVDFLLTRVSDTANTGCPVTPVIHTGEATFYTFASGAGSCMFDSTPGDLMIGAMNAIDYAGSLVCGECLSLTGPGGTILIRIVDMCPGCLQGDIDLSPLAFSRIADTSLGRVPISWHVVPCAVIGPIEYHFKEGSNQWWTAVQIRNHRNPILSLEYLTSQGIYKSVNRVEYNYFVEPAGMGPGPYTFRVTDVYGHVLVDAGVVPGENVSVPGHAQFPACSP